MIWQRQKDIVIASIEKWGDTNKYILKFKEVAKAIGPISLDKEMGKKGLAPQAPRYTSLDKLLKAKKLSQLFSPLAAGERQEYSKKKAAKAL